MTILNTLRHSVSTVSVCPVVPVSLISVGVDLMLSGSETRGVYGERWNRGRKCEDAEERELLENGEIELEGM